MKKCKMWIIAVLVAMLVSACGGRNATGGADPSGPSWQEQYDLGVRYLSEGNYQEAILAFTAAIEIDPKRAPAYVGRGDAYVRSGETEKNLAVARTDYERAIELDETLLDAYLKLAEVYQKQGDEEAAKQILQQGFAATNSEELQNRILELSKLKPKDGYPKTVRRDYGEQQYAIDEYDKYGQRIHETTYNADGTVFVEYIFEYDEWGNLVYEYVWESQVNYTTERFFDQLERVIEEKGSYHENESWLVEYDYANCPTVVISVYNRNSSMFINKEEFNASITYQMKDATHTVVNYGYSIGRFGDREDNRYFTSVTEYEPDQYEYGPGKWGFRHRVQITDYWEDGSIYKKYYDENGELLP